MKLIVDNEKNYSELLLIIDLFFSSKQRGFLSFDISHSTKIINKRFVIVIEIDGKKYQYSYMLQPEMFEKGHGLHNKFVKRYGKIALYRALSEHTGKDLPWGSLTGVRPSKLFYELMKEENRGYAVRKFKELYRVSEEKINLVASVVKNQSKKSTGDKDAHLYLHIPFCPSRCTYCSFISYSLPRHHAMLSDYVDTLITELTVTLKNIARKKYNIRSIYIGGGTPTILSSELLDKLLSHLHLPVEEFTVESGRVSTISKEKIDIMKKHGVTRICVNPQTFNKKVLQQVNREGCSKDTEAIITYAQNNGLLVNMDLIAGLPGETLASFKRSVLKTLSLRPDNITIHTLSLKNASQLTSDNFVSDDEKVVEKMVSWGYKELTENKYLPYYMYKQKHTLSHLENIGYSKKGSECLFNIDSMEESATIIANGAGAISKRLFTKESRIERAANVKDIPQYLNNIEEIVKKKLQLFK